MEMTISLDEAVHSSKRPWWDWTHGEWISIPGLAARERSADYTRFQRSMHSWGSRQGFTGNLAKIGADARFRLRWRRPDTAGVYLLWSTASMRWLDAAGVPARPASQYYRAAVFDTMAARRVCAEATSGPWPQYRTHLPGDDGSSLTISGRKPPVIPVPAIDLPELVAEQDMFAAMTRAERRVMWALEEGELGGDPAVSAIAAIALTSPVRSERDAAVRAAAEVQAASGQ